MDVHAHKQSEVHHMAVFGEALCRHTANSRSPVFQEYCCPGLVMWGSKIHGNNQHRQRPRAPVSQRRVCYCTLHQVWLRKPSQCQVCGGGLIKTRQCRKDWQTREERTCNEESRGAGAHTVLRNRDVFAGDYWRTTGQVLHLCTPSIQGHTLFVVPESQPVSFSPSFGRSSPSRCQEAVVCPGH